jgi:hypothetical protein
MIWQGFVQFVPQIPPDAESVSGQAHEIAFGAHPFEEHHQLEPEKDDRINRWASSSRIRILDEVIDKGEIKDAVQSAIKVVLGHQGLQGDCWYRCNDAYFLAHHRSTLPLSTTRRQEAPYHARRAKSRGLPSWMDPALAEST